jgi:hypothetical protein
MRAKHLHYLRNSGQPWQIDVYAVPLVMCSAGLRVIEADDMRRERDALAALLDGGALAELLASDRPIVADAVGPVFRFEEV